MGSSATSRRRARRGAAAVFATLTVVGVASVTVGATTDPGTGSSYAQSLYVTPKDGSLAVGAVLGEALAGHTNHVARAQSQGLDFGAVGLSLTSGQTCGNNAPLTPQQIPQPLETETGATGAAAGITQTPLTSAAKSSDPPPSFGSTEFVKANGTPYGEADTSYAPIDAGGVISISGSISKAWSGVVGGQRVAGATSDVGAVELVGGLVVLKGLHWETAYPSGGATKPSGSFSIGQLTVQGASVPLDQSLAAIQAAINSVLGTVGVQVVLPQITLTHGLEAVSPLQVLVVPNATRDGLIRQVNGPTEGVQQTLLGGLENGFPGVPKQNGYAPTCPTEVPITVAHVVIASVDGGGYFSSGIGGVNATTGAAAPNAFDLGLALPSLIGGQPGTPAISGSSGTVTSPTAPVSQLPTSPPVAPASSPLKPPSQLAAASTGHAKHGPLLAIGLGGLGVLALLTGGDWRKMRRAQREVTTNG